MSIFADCFPDSDQEALDLLWFECCSRCGHRGAMHSTDRGCTACELLKLMASSFDPILTRIEQLERIAHFHHKNGQNRLPPPMPKRIP